MQIFILFYHFYFYFSEDGLYRPWLDTTNGKTDEHEENKRAKIAYESVLTVTASSSSQSEEYVAFSEAVKDLSKSKFNYTWPPGPVNNFVANFHDAVSANLKISNFFRYVPNNLPSIYIVRFIVSYLEKCYNSIVVSIYVFAQVNIYQYNHQNLKIDICLFIIPSQVIFSSAKTVLSF